MGRIPRRRRRRSPSALLLLWGLVLITLCLEISMKNVVSAAQGEEAIVQKGDAVVGERQEGVILEQVEAYGADAQARAAAGDGTPGEEVAGQEDEEEDEEEASESGDHSEYLYEENAGPVIEYKSDAEDKMHPDFLFSTDNGPRMVEFYAWWCPHCQHFRDNFVQLAKQITSIARDQGGVDNIKVYSVSCTVFRDLCKHFGVDSYPQIKLFTANSTNVTASLSYWKLHPFDILNKLGVQVGNMDFMEKVPEGGNVKLKIRKGLGQGGAEQATDSVKGKNNINHANGDESSPELYRRTKKDLFSDAYLSFHFALKTGIYMSNGPLTNTTRDALHSWLSLLEKSMPPTWHIQNLIRALLKNFDSIIQGEDQLLAVVNQFPPRSKNWSRACSHGEKGAGYTCGLWQLFHIMTVGVVEWNLMIYEDLDMMLDVSEAALTLRNYVEHFFGCEVCRVNFVGAYDSCAHDRCNRLHQDAETDSEWMQLPLWLFETHNSVNIRLLKERAEREKWPQLVTRDDEIKKEWPSRLECPKCWREDGGWDEKTVYRYMRMEYWPEDTITQVYREEMQDSGDDRRGEFPLPPMAVQLIPIGLVLAMAVAWYKKKLERTRSGLHKRRD